MKSIKQAAQELSLSEMTIRRFIKDGKLRSVKIGHSVRLYDEEVEALKKPQK